MAEHSSARPGDLRGAASAGHLDQELQEAHPVWRRRQRGIPAREEGGDGGQAWGRGNVERTPVAESDTAGFFRLQTLWTGPSPRGASVSLTLKWDGGYTCCAVETFKWTIASESTQTDALKEER